MEIKNGLLVMTRGSATVNYIPKRNPTVPELLTKPYDTSQTGRSGLSVHTTKEINHLQCLVVCRIYTPAEITLRTLHFVVKGFNMQDFSLQ